ncbi:hypothetical protein HG536_0D01390 [Torulaspora globosa]|uniref:Ran GTPase-activating protein 1 n=1 Tax=Torulaspora globosa TaxID=48254 RepID=A0A7G3ZGI1_9SACH|nr:uncharacterized protein HG536_0D01390 [Torulaspora globosa]QLL32617.1 hypothetical protein HG536_0D01390 [Torulaspora globosa]
MASLHYETKYDESEVFSIAGKALKLTSASDIEPHLEELGKLTKCSKLDLSGNTIGADASKALAQFIETHDSVYKNVREINFADLYTSRLVDEVVDSLGCLLPALLKCDRLEILNLSDNAFGLRTIDILENFIASATHLKHLLLSNNGMGPFAGERIGKALFQLAQNKKRKNEPFLETFICGRNRLENGSALYLALGLKSHGDGLKSVKLYQNGIRPRGVATLIHYGLKFNKNLQILDMQDNTFTKSASSILADNLPAWKDTLRELNINDCLLKGQGASEVFKIFNDHKFEKLESLRANYNEMTQETVEELLVPALQKGNLPKLKDLEINGNRLDEDSEALDTLQELFEELELDDLEELDSDEEESEEEEDEDEKLQEIETEIMEKQLLELSVEHLTEDLSKTRI